MTALHKRIRGAGLGRVEFICPGCDQTHQIPVRRDGLNISPAWGYNGDADAPTFTPSILVRGNRGGVSGTERNPFVCHSFVKDGRIQYLGDCTHALAGQTVALPEFKT